MKLGKDVIGIGLGVVIVQDGKIYLQKRGPGCRDLVGFWELPGGALEFGETLREGAAREILEETGLQVEVRDCAGIAEELHLGHWVSFVFIAEVVGGEMGCREPTKVVEQGFFPLDMLPQPLSPVSAQNIKDYLSGKRHEISLLR